MEEPNVDDGWRTDPMRNENRYQGIIDKSAFPPLAFLYESFREDRTLRFPRMLLSTFWTARRIPRALFLRGERKEAYAVETMKIWSRTMVKMARMNLTVRGVERLRPESNYLFACNHSATLDSVIAYRALPCPAAFVVNQELTSLPVIKYWLEKSRCVLVRQGDREAETRAFGELLSRLKEKKNFLIFPEGYIYQGSGLAEFKRGGLYAAVFSGVAIVPMCVVGAQDVMHSGSLHVHPGLKVLVEFGEPIATKDLSRDERKNVEAVVHRRMLDLKCSLTAEWNRDRES
ncbi:MAG: lysophospholipid acyltransferase family protein [Rectinemataceae bacterium]